MSYQPKLGNYETIDKEDYYNMQYVASLVYGRKMSRIEALELADTSFNIVTNDRDFDTWGVKPFTRYRRTEFHRS